MCLGINWTARGESELQGSNDYKQCLKMLLLHTLFEIIFGYVLQKKEQLGRGGNNKEQVLCLVWDTGFQGRENCWDKPNKLIKHITLELFIQLLAHQFTNKKSHKNMYFTEFSGVITYTRDAESDIHKVFKKH